MATTSSYGICFSPTGNSRKVCQAILQTLKPSTSRQQLIDITTPQKRTTDYSFGKDDIVVVSLPVYAGRIPNKLLPFVENNLHGDNTPVIITVTYGNRSYDNALKELEQVLTVRGFRLTGAAAIPSEHAFTEKLAKGRPTNQDLEAVRRFAQDIITKDYNAISQEIPGEWPCKYYTPKGMDGNPVNFLKAKPQTDEALCTHCGLCSSLCPMGTLSPEGKPLEDGVCIKCHGCIRVCPNQAKHFDNEDFSSHVRMLETHYASEKKADFFL